MDAFTTQHQDLSLQHHHHHQQERHQQPHTMWSLPANVKKKRPRASDGTQPVNPLDTAFGKHRHASPPTPQVPRISSSAASWGVADLSDSDDDLQSGHDQFSQTTSQTSDPHQLRPSGKLSSPIASRDAIFPDPRPYKRPHLDETTSGRFASLQLDPSSTNAGVRGTFPAQGGNKAGGVSAIFGQAFLPAPISADLGLNQQSDPAPTAPIAPPSSPTKPAKLAFTANDSAQEAYRLSVAPPTSPVRNDPGYNVPPASPINDHRGGKQKEINPTRIETFDRDVEDMDMRIRRGPTSYEIEPNRIFVSSLDDTSSSDNDEGTDKEDLPTPPRGGDASHEQGVGPEYLVNTELMEKLEAHRRAVLTGTSERDIEQSAANKGPSTRSRRGGRRSGGGLSGLGSLLSARRRSGQSSPASSSGYASPINSEDARDALVLWRDPKEVLKVTSSSFADKSASNMPASSFGSNNPASQPQSSFWSMPTKAPGASTQVESPLAAQQSSLSSSYFPTSNTESHFGGREAAPSATQQWTQMYHHNQPVFGQPAAGAQPLEVSDHPIMSDDMELDG